MKLTRRKRIAFELLGPPFAGALIASAFELIKEASQSGFSAGPVGWNFRIQGSVLQFVMFLPFAYLFAGVQSIVYTLVMEWRFARGLDPCSWRSVGLSTLLGFASGAAICLGYGFRRSDVISLWMFFGGTGFAVGLVLGLLIKRWSAQTEAGDQDLPA